MHLTGMEVLRMICLGMADIKHRLNVHVDKDGIVKDVKMG